MKILKFINSRSIANYLDEINYEFNALKAAFTFWQSKLTTFDEKFDAWEHIIADMADTSVKKRPGGWETDEPSLHAFCGGISTNAAECTLSTRLDVILIWNTTMPSWTKIKRS